MRITRKQFKQVVKEYKHLQLKSKLRAIIQENCDLQGGLADLEKEEEPSVGLPAIAEPLSSMPEEEAVTVDASPPVPEDYEAVTSLLSTNPEFVDLAITQVMNMAGAGCERSSVMAMIDFLKGMLGEKTPEETVPPAELDPLLMAPMLLDPAAPG